MRDPPAALLYSRARSWASFSLAACRVITTPGFYQRTAPHGSLRPMNADQIATDLLRQEHTRLRARAAFYHGCSGDRDLLPESREASRRVADALGRLVGDLGAVIDSKCGVAQWQSAGPIPR